MENVNIITDKNAKSFIFNLEYGSNLVCYSSNDIHRDFFENIEIINEMFGQECIWEKPHEEGGVANGQFVSEEIPNVYNIICSVKEGVEQIDECNFEIKKTVQRVKENQTLEYLNLDKRLFKYAGRICFSEGIKCGSDAQGFFFNAAPKSMPLSRQIEKAYFEGKDKIEFDSATNSVSTVRCYVSTLASKTGKKISCSISKDKITVQFRPPTNEELFGNELSAIFGKFAPEIGHDKAISILTEFVMDNTPTTTSTTQAANFDTDHDFDDAGFQE